jgi:hypothetical protein
LSYDTNHAKAGSLDVNVSIFMEALHVLNLAVGTGHNKSSGLPQHVTSMTTRTTMSQNESADCQSAGCTNIGPTAMCNRPDDKLFVSCSIGSIAQALDAAALSPLQIFARPIIVNTSLLLQMKQHSRHHLVAAAVMYNTALLYHLRGSQTGESEAGAYQLSDLYYGASLHHMERAVVVQPAGLCGEMTEAGLVLLLAIWNNRAHLQYANYSSTTRSHCIDSMRLLLVRATSRRLDDTGTPTACRLLSEEIAMFQLNLYFLENLGNEMASAA